MKKNTGRRNWTQEITDRFINELEAGVVPWVKPWEHWTSWSRNTGADYNGINQLLLSGGEFVTFNQIKQAGGKLNKGSKGQHIVFYKKYDKEVEDPETGETEIERHRVLKGYTVFRVSDTDLEIKHDKKQKVHKWDNEAEAERIIEAYAKKHGVTIKHGSNEAFNNGGDNSVTLPEREQFISATEYYSTVFHELVHSTARFVKRDLSKYHTSKKERAREELVAEIGAAYVLSYLGLDENMTFKNSAAYVKGWAGFLKDDAAAIMYATPQAITAANLILNI